LQPIPPTEEQRNSIPNKLRGGEKTRKRERERERERKRKE